MTQPTDRDMEAARAVCPVDNTLHALPANVPGCKSCHAIAQAIAKAREEGAEEQWQLRQAVTAQLIQERAAVQELVEALDACVLHNAGQPIGEPWDTLLDAYAKCKEAKA